MTIGLLGKADLLAATDTLLGAALTENMVINVRLTNRNSADITVRLAIGAGVSPAAADYLEYDSNIPPNGVLENTGLAVSIGEKVWVRSSAANVSARAHGIPTI